ncbi:SusD/RagB family nutrient-binding outer membrane lipoprotein [Chitinophaga sancti]|uniref:SusD/RagB family nutrient-binding outer membrane lipoprotein n=1 Tax=Chitinophaga sancti TaxID=1004 RepID=UPI002A763E69|nr:SusD/RagB family nutrient-binding outer membrane lipoprotein [Chitinophaga sancti]WPQ62837.1 SusD/RagB family nutrient-binding outer membrane lipoprotein [Chitinophaga sancti]
MKKYIIYGSFAAMGILSTVSCTKNITDLNTNPNKPSSVSASSLYASATKEMADAITSTNVNLGIFRLIVQQWTETTYIDESNYNLVTRTIPDNFWDAFYTDALMDLKEAKTVLEADESTDATVKKNMLAQIDVMSVYGTSVLVNTFGNVPYSQSLNSDNLFNKYDDAHTIYTDLIARLDADLAAFDESATGMGTSNMLFSSDEIVNWKKFTNSLKLRLGILLADIDPATAQTIVTAASAGAFDTQGEYAKFPYSTVPPNTNPLWEDLVQSGRQDFVGSNTFVDYINSVEDPRRPFYFTTIGGIYKGGTNGVKSPYANYSHPGSLLEQKDLPGVFIDYSEVEFIRAEAIERGWAVGGTAITHYNNAITNSILYWGGTEEDAVTYLARTDVNYLTAAGDWKQKIGMQEWIALYNRGFDAWTAQRHLDYPQLTPPPKAQSGYPVRFTYPIAEQNLNTTNYNEAASAIGGDVVETKLFWDIY